MERADQPPEALRIAAAGKTFRPQVAALPVRVGDHGQLEVLLVTSRESRRWVLPKGWPIKGKKDHKAAEREALEEAGVRGNIEKRSLGSYTYPKRLKDRVEPCRVMVYRLDVQKELKSWPEEGERERKWFAPFEAAELVSEQHLAVLLNALDRSAE